MPEGTSERSSSGTPPNGGRATPDELSELRHLLLAPERREIAQVKEQIELLGRVDADAVAPVLPQAVIQSSRDGHQITEAMLPVFEEDIGLSVKRHPEKLADLLFPVMGPAIRKAIREAISDMIQALNQTVDYAVSPRAIQWRLEAMRTGKTFTEVVFLRTMLYRVEQAFLIHRETGLLLQHATAPNIHAQDPDMVSGMLTAIQHFVHDSFNRGLPKKDGQPNGVEELESLQVGDVTVWIEQGPVALVAGVIRGHAPRDLRSVFHVAVEDIHREQHDDLVNFTGDTAVFALAKPHLEGCLQFQQNPAVAVAAAKRRFFQKPAFFLGVLLLGALIVGGGFWYASITRWNGYLAAVQQQPGLVVTNAQRGWWWGKHAVIGLRDPMAADPRSFLAASGYAPDDVESTWTPYQALEPPFVLARAKNLLAPPDTVALALQADGVLEASGLAPGSWIADARKLARAVPGVITFKDDRLVDERWAELQRLRDKVQVYNVLFPQGRTEPLPSEQQNLNDLIADLTRVVSLASEIRRPASIEVLGHTDGSGAEGLNQSLSLRRAEVVRAALAAKLPRGVPLTVKGVSNADPLREERSDEDRAWNRRVSAKVTIGDVRPGEAR